jgi:hypothetical protein
MPRWIAASVVSALLTAQSSLHAQAPKPRSICEVLVNLEEFRGKDIEVRGVVVFGPELFALEGDDCESTLVMNGYAWPRRIWLSIEGQRLPEVVPPESVRLDKDAYLRLVSIMEAKGSGKVRVTIHGRLLERMPFVDKWPDGSNRLAGFGHRNLNPAQLVIRTVRDIEVLSKE